MDKDKIVCTCFNISVADIEEAVKNEGVTNYEELQDKTGCGTGCGACEDEAIEVLEELKK